VIQYLGQCKGDKEAMKKKRYIHFILLFAICLFSTIISSKVVSAEETITQGVYIDSIHVGGMTADEAKQSVQEYVNELKGKTVTVNVDDKSETITLGELDYDYRDNNFIEEALAVGKNGNLIKRYKELKDVEQETLVFPLEFQISDEKVKEFVTNKLGAHNIPAVNASLKRESGKFTYTDSTPGRKVLVNETISTIKKALYEGWNQQDLVLSADIETEEPLYTLEDVKKCNTLLGSFSTIYATSTADRAGNLANGARLINNLILYPGDEFSAYDELTPFTKENGYFEAGAYANGLVVDSIGGGACQVTTTLYNAVLAAELEVTERSAHSMTIGYADLSRDAAIAGTWKNFKFKNNTKTPILVQAFTQNRTITFNIWGEETRPSNRKVVYKTVILDETKPGPDVITEDPTKPTTYMETTQSAHIGYVAELYKIVYENNVEVSRTRVNRSVYNASPRYVTIGTKEVEPEETEIPVNDTEDVIEEIPQEELQNGGNPPDNGETTAPDSTN
jgi:vancomycin resistance protein YoaR